MSFTLLPDQEILVEKVRGSMRAGNKWVLMQAATGSGKSVMGAEIIAGVRKKQKKCMLVVPRIELLKQTAWTLREFGLPFGVIAGGHAANPFADIHIATTQSLGRLVGAGKAPQKDLIMIDETHYYAGMIDKIVDHYKSQGVSGVGMSATPQFFSGRGLGCWYDDMVCGESVRWLIENKRLSDYRLFAPVVPDLSKVGVAAGDYKKDELIAYMKAHGKLIGDSAKHYKQHAMGQLAIAYCVSIDEARRSAMMFNQAGIPADFIDGTLTDAETAKVIRKFARREILVLTNCELLTFGFDLKSSSGLDAVIESVIDLAPTKSLPRQMQKWGRGLRYKERPAMMFDHAGNSMIHGLPDEARTWTLKDETKKSSSSTGGGASSVKQCNGGWTNPDMSGAKKEACYFVHRPSPRCPHCGAWYEVAGRAIETIAGTLAETRQPLRKLTMNETQARAAAIDHLIHQGIKKGMPAWAAKKWAIKKVEMEIEKRLRKEQELEISLVIGDQKLPLNTEE